MAVLDLAKPPASAPSASYDAFADLYDAFTWDHDYERWVSVLEPVAKTHGLTGQPTVPPAAIRVHSSSRRFHGASNLCGWRDLPSTIFSMARHSSRARVRQFGHTQ